MTSLRNPEEDAEPPLTTETQGGPWTEANDPWQGAHVGRDVPTERPSREQGGGRGPRPSMAGVTATAGAYSGGDAPPMRIIHDIPPAWNGETQRKNLSRTLNYFKDG